jgi:hypothetical protein
VIKIEEGKLPLIACQLAADGPPRYGAVLASSRFGVEIAELQFTSGTIHIEPIGGGECRVAVSSRMATRKLEVVARAFVPPIPNTPVENVKVKIQGTFLQAIICDPSCNLSFDLNPDVPYELRELTTKSILCVYVQSQTQKLSFLRSGAVLLPV